MQPFKVIFPDKFTDNQLDIFVDGFFSTYKEAGNTISYHFDFSALEWISNQELLVLTALFKNLIDKGVTFRAHFLKNGSTKDIDRRHASQIFQIWEVWKLYQIVRDGKFEKYFDIDINTVNRLATQFGLNAPNGEIYNRYGITPFVTLDRVKNYDDKLIGEMMEGAYRLGRATSDILRSYNCSMPFENHTLSAIVTKELYENFLDHSGSSIFGETESSAHMSLSMVPKLQEKNFSSNQVQHILGQNFLDEMNPAFKPFFTDEKTGTFKNRSYLHFSFLDFGEGITGTLRENFLNKRNLNAKDYKAEMDPEILSYAFEHTSSKDPLEKRFLDRSVIPRGLFDLLSIVRRFNGMIVARSGYGKIYFDFATKNPARVEGVPFGKKDTFFPGTLITVYIPERNSTDRFDTSKILPITTRPFEKKEQIEANYISIYNLLSSLQSGGFDKAELYSRLLDSINREITKDSRKNLVHYFDFLGFEHDERITKKIIHYLISDYSINAYNNIIILNPPSTEFLTALNDEILHLNSHVKNYRIHPLPFVSFNNGNLEVFWMGVYRPEDAQKLSDLLLDYHDLRKSDFTDPDAISGNINHFDNYGNLISYFDRDEILKLFSQIRDRTIGATVNEILLKYVRHAGEDLFLCSGNYYQKEYIQLYDSLSNRDECDMLAGSLREKISLILPDSEDVKYVSVTSSSQQLTKSPNFGNIPEARIISLDSYQSIEDNAKLSEKLHKGDRVVLVCDVISTGYFVKTFQKKITVLGANVVMIAVLVNAIDRKFESTKLPQDLIEKIVSVIDYPMVKFRRKDVSELIKERKTSIIRINPYTNTPITEALEGNPLNRNVLLDNAAFINVIKEDQVKAGYFKFNNLIHPYFFDMANVLTHSETSRPLLIKLFDELKSRVALSFEVIFYPKGSGIQSLDFGMIKSEILKNHTVTICELERFSTNEGWRFPHPPEFMIPLVKRKSALIFDDGSCSGESLMQMIDEVATLEVQSITVVSVIGRLNDHKKDFFARLRSVKSRDKVIPIEVFFGVHWHIPTYYMEESPILREKKMLENLIAVSGIPDGIKTTADNILDELQLKDEKQESNRYLLKRRDNNSIIKDLILIKEEIGKVTSYRFFKEYFDFFDDFIRQYEGGVKDERYKRIESICAVFLHEPNLFQKIRTVLPDLAEKIEVFIQTILFGNPEKEKRPKLRKDQLFYNWSNKNILHLFFIVFKNERLFEKLTIENLVSIIKSFATSQSDLDYLLYRLIRYIPVLRLDISKRGYAGLVRMLIESLKTKIDLGSRAIKQIKVFSSFISTLPSDSHSFMDALAKLRSNYGRIDDDAHHNEYIFTDKAIMITQLHTLIKRRTSGEAIDEQINVIKKHWDNISLFIEELLTFTSNFPEYFFWEEFYNTPSNNRERPSLREMHAFIRDAIINEDFNDVQTVISNINKIFGYYIDNTTNTFQLFKENTVDDIEIEFNEFFDSIKNDLPDYNLEILTPVPKISVNLPQIYLHKVVFKELRSNLRYAEKSAPIQIIWQDNDEIIVLVIKNRSVQRKPSTGGGQGLQKLKKLNSFPIKTSYSGTQDGSEYIQEIKFSKI